MPAIWKQSVTGQLECEQLPGHGPGSEKLLFFRV